MFEGIEIFVIDWPEANFKVMFCIKYNRKYTWWSVTVFYIRFFGKCDCSENSCGIAK